MVRRPRRVERMPNGQRGLLVEGRRRPDLRFLSAKRGQLDAEPPGPLAVSECYFLELGDGRHPRLWQSRSDRLPGPVHGRQVGTDRDCRQFNRRVPRHLRGGSPRLYRRRLSILLRPGLDLRQVRRRYLFPVHRLPHLRPVEARPQSEFKTFNPRSPQLARGLDLNRHRRRVDVDVGRRHFGHVDGRSPQLVPAPPAISRLHASGPRHPREPPLHHPRRRPPLYHNLHTGRHVRRVRPLRRRHGLPPHRRLRHRPRRLRRPHLLRLLREGPLTKGGPRRHARRNNPPRRPRILAPKRRQPHPPFQNGRIPRLRQTQDEPFTDLLRRTPRGPLDPRRRPMPPKKTPRLHRRRLSGRPTLLHHRLLFRPLRRESHRQSIHVPPPALRLDARTRPGPRRSQGRRRRP
mmetsp:Transcript_1836/g.6184  ORF Transcript_1836/g.6184 Transcript_1836/m.6184 type:complete len:404 (-) Transcript_1836:670-1881(-)